MACNLRSASGLLLFTCGVLLSSCTAQTLTRSPSTLLPFATSTRTQLPAEESAGTPEGLVAAETPLPSPTPFAYTVQQGDTISSIALEFGVSIDDLVAANPESSPGTLSVGQVINVPAGPRNASGEPTPTAAAFAVRQIECYPTVDGGMWCLVLAQNDSPDFLENLSAQVTLVDADNSVVASQTAILPLNILPPGASLPLTVYFPPAIPSGARPRVQVLTAIRLLPGDVRYLPAITNNTLVRVNADGRSAQLSGHVLLPPDAAPAGQVWVAATAFDEAGRVVGVRRWESGAGLSPGGSLPFEFAVSSLAGRIDRVEFAVEARP